MTKKQRRQIEYQSYQLYQPPLDLFGGVVVTHDDVRAWVAAVSPVHLAHRTFDQYVTRYAVADKVAAAKIRRQFDAITAAPRPQYHARLDLQRII
jgi:hypothetical protein